MLFQRKRKLFHLRLIILSHLCGFCFYEPTIDVNGIPPMVQQGKWYLLAEGWLTGNHEELLAHGRDSLKGRRTGLIHLFCIGEYLRCFLKTFFECLTWETKSKDSSLVPSRAVSVELNSPILSRVRRMVTNRREPGNHQGTW